MPDAFTAQERLESTAAAGQIVIEVDAAHLAAALSLYPNVSGKPFAEEDITRALAPAGITRGLELERVHEAIGRATETNAPVERVVIATGREKHEGRDAYFEYPPIDRTAAEQATDPDDPDALTPARLSAARVVNVREGETVGIYHALEEGVAGFTVRGQILGVRPCIDATPKPAQGLRWEGQDLVAAVDGRLIVEERSLRVLDVLTYDEDLTIAHGDIDFVGKLVVGRNVEAGLKIRCLKDMVVKGSLLGSDVYVEGNLSIENGIVGSDSTTIEVRGDLKTRFVENANLRVWGSASIADSFVTSVLLCADRLEMSEGRGHFVSGHAAARCGMQLKSVGIPLGAKVRLAVGRNLLAKERMDVLRAEMEKLKAQLKSIRELESKIGPMTKAYAKLPQRKQEEIELLLDQIPRLDKALSELQQEVDDLQSKLVPLHDVLVTVTGSVHADTVVEFPLHWMRVPSETAEVSFRFNDVTAKVEWVPAAA